MSSDLQRVRSFWEDHVNNEYYTRHARGSRAYFAEIERRRYKFHYHLPELFERIRSHGTEGKRLLEIGCGIGIDTLRLAKLGFREVVAADLTETAIAIASKRARHEGIANVRFVTANAESLEFSEGAFDAIYSFGVIHHTADIGRAVAEIHRVLAPGGRAYVMIYHRRSLVAAVHELFRLPYESPKDLEDECPVVLRHSRAEAEHLFGDFDRVEIHADYPFTYGMRFVSWAVPKALQRGLGRLIGWHLMIEASKTV
ncbi:MAG: methyltransferase domain-containing protein [Thermoanaerobaculia bacterium]